ncbi:MAG: cobalamin-dependent protein [Deltaproteobacteria bacterium]|nr:cobalamin-dependent protein [Deltaproteobacteria bacterium]
MEVLIISTNRHKHPVPVMPYGACLAAEAAAREGHGVRLLDLLFEPDPLAAVKAAIRARSPDIIGLSIRNLDNNDMQAPEDFVAELAEVTRTIRRLSAAPLILGGAAVGVMPEPLLRYTRADYAILGDGEAAFPAFLKAMENGGARYEVPRLAWLEKGYYRTGPQEPLELEAAALRPRFENWLNVKAYCAANAALPVQSKRGCPYSCIYCTYGTNEGEEYRLFPPEDAARAVIDLAAAGRRDIEFVDNVFNSPYLHALEVCDHLARTPHRARLTTVELNPAFVDRRLLTAMEEAGFVGVGVTAESAADEVLAGLQKGYTRSEVEGAAAAVRKSNLPCFWLFLLGGPGETEQTVTETLGFAQRVLRRGDVAFFNVGIRIYPGTELARLARQQGVLQDSGQAMLQPKFYFSPELSREWTLKQVRRAAAANLSLLHSASLSHPWLPAVNRLVGRLPMRPPLWRHTRIIRRVIRALGRDI